MLTNNTNQRRLRGEALELRALMAGLTLAGLNDAPKVEVGNAKAELSDVYAFAQFSSGRQEVTAAPQSNSSEQASETAADAEVSPALTEIDQALVGLYQTGEYIASLTVDAAINSLVGLADTRVGQSSEPTADSATDGAVLALAGSNSVSTTTQAADGRSSSDSFELDLFDLQREVESQSPTQNMISNMQKARHDPMIATLMTIR